jgi:hypothetical protein
MLTFCLGRNNTAAQKKTHSFPQRWSYVPQISINCLACPKRVKYNQISNKQAVIAKKFCKQNPLEYDEVKRKKNIFLISGVDPKRIPFIAVMKPELLVEKKSDDEYSITFKVNGSSYNK